MQIKQYLFKSPKDIAAFSDDSGKDVDLVLAFFATDFADKPEMAKFPEIYPNAVVCGCSTSGEIYKESVNDDTISLTTVQFDKTKIKIAGQSISDAADSTAVGAALARELTADDLAHVICFSEGLVINGSELVAGLTGNLPENVKVTGGLSGDGDRFGTTYVYWEGKPVSQMVTAIGLYGKSLQVGYGSVGGWDPFGPERIITKSKGNVLYELDNKPALELYKKYLGPHAEKLPASGLLFPLAIREPESDAKTDKRLVRTILSIDEDEHALIFAGDVPTGHYAQLMKANFERLIEGASGAANISVDGFNGHKAELALLISCVGRKLVLKQRVEEEVEAVQEIVGPGASYTGFYSYGEISPFTPNAKCELHNQTMTITTLVEV